MKNVYLAGPMTSVGPPDFNYPTFNSVDAWLTIHGIVTEDPSVRQHVSVLNPARNFNGATDREYREYMRADLKMLAQADAIVLLPGWQDSPGALLEVDIARKLELDFYEATGPKRVYNINGQRRPTGWKVLPIDTPTHEPAPSASPWHDSAAVRGLYARYFRLPPEQRAEWHDFDCPGNPYPHEHDRAAHEAAQPEPLADWERELLGLKTDAEIAFHNGDDGRTTTFSSGATRDTSVGKLDFEGFYNPLVVERFAQYMDKNRLQSNGSYRDSDNWQAGFTRNSYAKSLFRHFMDFWKRHRGYDARSDIEEALCAVIFNAQGYLLELLLDRDLRETD